MATEDPNTPLAVHAVIFVHAPFGLASLGVRRATPTLDTGQTEWEITPGGGKDPDDPCLCVTLMRELEEELGCPRSVLERMLSSFGSKRVWIPGRPRPVVLAVLQMEQRAALRVIRNFKPNSEASALALIPWGNTVVFHRGGLEPVRKVQLDAFAGIAHNYYLGLRE